MARIADPAIAQRNEELIAEAKAQIEQTGTINIEGLAEKYVLTVEYAKKLLKGAKIEVPKTPPGPRKALLQTPISPLHYQIGRDVTSFRVFKNGGNIQYTAAALKLSASALNKVERGCYDLTLKELQHISKVIGHSIDDLVKERNTDAG